MAITAAIIGIVGGAVSAGIGASASNKTNKANTAAAAQASEDEAKRRKAAAFEAERLIDEFNDLRQERPDISIESFLRDIVTSLDGPQAEKAREAFEKATIRDFENAQYIADQASQNNVDVFELLNDQVSGGRAGEFLRERNRLVDETNTEDAFNRALQLRAPTIPAGTVQLDSNGRFVEGQRADKKVFNTAFEVDQALQDKKYSRLTDVIASDRTVAERQQERASTFLPATDFTGTQLRIIDSSRSAAALYQTLDEDRQFTLIRDFLMAANSNQTANPNYQSTAGSDALTSKGIDTALRSAGQLSIANSNKKK